MTFVVSSRRLARVSKSKTPNPKEAQPQSTPQLRREGRLARIAKALASGATITDIAEAEGISRTLASREANSPQCRQLITDFVNAEHDEMRALFYRSLRTIEHALNARREYMTKDGEIVYGGPDHYARLAATKPEKKEKRLVTLQELEELIKSAEATNGLETN